MIVFRTYAAQAPYISCFLARVQSPRTAPNIRVHPTWNPINLASTTPVMVCWDHSYSGTRGAEKRRSIVMMRMVMTRKWILGREYRTMGPPPRLVSSYGWC